PECEACVRIHNRSALYRAPDEEAAEAETGACLYAELARRIVELLACRLEVSLHVVVRRLREEHDVRRRADRQRGADTDTDRDRQQLRGDLRVALTRAERRVLRTDEREIGRASCRER